MTPARLEALNRLRKAQGDRYDGDEADAYEMFLIVDECFRDAELDEVSAWLPYVPGMTLGSGEYLFAIRNQRTGENRPKQVFRVWDAKGLADNSQSVHVLWYMPLPANKLPAMKIQDDMT